MNNNEYSNPWITTFDEPPPPPPPPPPPALETFTQEKVNQIVAAERQKWQKTQNDALTELEALRTKSKLTENERTELDARIEAMRAESMTKEQLAADKQKKLEKAAKDSADKLTAERDGWKARYTDQTINTAILAGATGEVKAYNPQQLISMLKPQTQLVEELNDEGKPTGNFIPKIQIISKDDKGKEVALVLPVGEAIKKMSEMDEYANLFVGKSVGGVFRLPGGNPASRKLADLARTDPKAYREARAAGQKE